jgi:hypothetical protein
MKRYNSAWTKLFLKFKPTHVSIDRGVQDGDFTCETHFKFLFGKTYVVNVNRYRPAPSHPNCRCTLAPLEEV